QLRSSHESIIVHGIRIGREDPAGMVGNAGRPHHLEIGLPDRMGRGPEHAEFGSPTENIPHFIVLLFEISAGHFAMSARSREVYPQCRLKMVALLSLAPARSASPPPWRSAAAASKHWCSPPSRRLLWSLEARRSILPPSIFSMNSRSCRG